MNSHIKQYYSEFSQLFRMHLFNIFLITFKIIKKKKLHQQQNYNNIMTYFLK